jgi:hypothetical protein
MVLLAKYNYNNQVKEYNMDRACSKHAAKRNVWKILLEKSDEKRPLGSCKRRWDDNIKTHFRQIG